MKSLKHKYIDQDINLVNDKVYNLVIENPTFLRNFLTSLEDQIVNQEDFLLFVDGVKELKLAKEGFLVWNPLKIEVDQKKLDTFIQKDISVHTTPAQKEEFELLLLSINNYIQSLSYSYSIPLTFQSELSLQSFLKAIALSTIEEPDGFLEKLLFQIRKLAFGFSFDVFFFLNLHDYLSYEEMDAFFKEMHRMELYPVLISSHLPSYKNGQEFVILIDQDLCELHIES